MEKKKTVIEQFSLSGDNTIVNILNFNLNFALDAFYQIVLKKKKKKKFHYQLK